MTERMKASVGMATVFIVVILATAVGVTFTRDRDASYRFEAEWSTPFGNVQSLQINDLDGDGSDDVFVQDPTSYAVFDATGAALFSAQLNPPISVTMGDPDGDGSENVVTFEAGGAVTLRRGADVSWSTVLQSIGAPARAAVIRFASGAQVVAGDSNGQLVALDGRTGAELWRARLPGDSEARGLDDVVIDGDRLLVAANRAGSVVAFTDEGATAWQASINGLRRMRTFDTNGDGRGEVYFGGEGGSLHVRDADGLPLWERRFGQQLVELRDGELDGDPSSREIVAAGRNGGVFVYGADGTGIWSATIGERVADVRTADLDGDGSDEVVVGGERGRLVVFSSPNGTRYPVDLNRGPVAALDEGFVTRSGQIVIAAGSTASLGSLTKHDAPFFYTPIAAGLLLSFVIAGVAVFVGGLPERAATRIVVTDNSPEGLLARRRMLFENIADVEALRDEGEIAGEAALARLNELRTQLAETDQALRAAQVTTPVETMKCPNCGGRVRLGRDQCDYCGEVVIG